MKTLLPEINSADKRFHNGNPATGEQGTRVTDTWLNDVQDRIRDMQVEAHYVLQQAGFTPKAETQTQLYQAIVNIIDNNRRSASTTQKGEVQLIDNLTTADNQKALTAKQGKALNDKITPLNFYKVNVKGGSTPVTFDLGNREHWIAEIGSVYKGTGHYQLGLHNTAISTISNLPLNDKSAVQLDISVMGAYSLIRCHYLALNRTFTSRFDWNKSTFPLAWFEEVKLDSNGKVPRETVFAGSLESNYRVVIRRNEAKYTPYQMIIDNSVDMTGETVPQKIIGELTCRAGAGDGVLKSILKTILLADKNATVEMGGWDASQRYKIFLKGFTKTNNVVIGSDSDDGSARLQVTGDIHAKGAVVVTNQSWVKHKYPIDNGGEWRMEFNPNSETDPRFNVLYEMKNGSTRYCSFPKLERSETVAYRSWVDSRIADNFKRGELTTQNLNDVQGYGVYMQGANANATEARNYPTRTAGTLMVLPSAYGVMQKYTNFNTGEEYQRNRNIDGTWRAWRQVDGINKVSKSGDSMTGMLTLPKLSLTQRNIAFGDDYLYKNNANNAQHGFHLFEDSGEPNDNKKGNARLFVNEIRANHTGQGMYAGQYHSFAPFFVDESGSVSRDTYHPFVKGKVRSANQYGAAFSLGYTTYQGAQGTDGWGKGVIHLIEDNGKERSWTFEHNGNFQSAGDVITGQGVSLNRLHDFVRNVSRVNKSTTIRGTNTEDSGNTRNISLTGMVMTHPDGRIVQILHLRNFRMIWFSREQPGVGGYGGDRGYHISLPLWTAMPNKIVNVTTQLMRATGSVSATYGSEGGEWVSAWQLWGKENEKSWVNINLNRIGGGSSEPIDLYVVVEGY